MYPWLKINYVENEIENMERIDWRTVKRPRQIAGTLQNGKTFYMEVINAEEAGIVILDHKEKKTVSDIGYIEWRMVIDEERWIYKVWLISKRIGKVYCNLSFYFQWNFQEERLETELTERSRLDIITDGYESNKMKIGIIQFEMPQGVDLKNGYK